MSFLGENLDLWSGNGGTGASHLSLEASFWRLMLSQSVVAVGIVAWKVEA
jgi:hypothetical protein